LESKYPEIMQRFKDAADKENLTPGARVMYDKLLADALPEALQQNPDLAQALLKTPIEFYVIDKNSEKITTVIYIVKHKILSFDVGGKDYLYKG